MQEDPLRLWSGAEDGTIVVSTYDARARALVPQHTLRGHQGAVHCIQREPNGARVWSASLDGALLTWDRERLQPLARMPISFPPRARHFVFTVAPVAAATAQRLWCCGTDGTVRCFLSLTPSDDVDAVAARRADAARRYTELTAAEAAARAALTEAAQQVLLTHYIDEARAVAETAWAHAQRADAVARRAEAAAAAAARQLEEESVASAAATQRSITLQQQLEALGETSMALRLALDGGAADARAAQAQLRFDIAQLEGRVADLTAEAASARAALGHRAAELQAVAAARDTLQRALMHRDEERQNLEQHLAEARAREAQLRLTVSSLEEQLAVAREREAGSAHSAALRDDHARGVELQLQALRAELETARADARRVTEMKSLAVRERDECRAHVQRLQQLHEGEVTENAAELERLQLRIAQLDVNAVRSEDARVALSAALAASRDEGALLARECDVLKAEIAQLTRELLAARQGAEAHAGETAAVRQQMEVLRMSLVTPAAVATAPLKVLPNPRRPTSPPRPVVPSAALEIPPRVNFSTAARIALYPAVDRGLNSPPPRPFSPVDAPRAASTTASPRRTPARITGPLPLWSPSHE
jgi:chromosome segregation ATPase